MDFIATVKNINFEKIGKDLLLFGGADFVLALIAVETTIVPMLKSPIGAAFAIIILNLVINLIKKFLTSNQELTK